MPEIERRNLDDEHCGRREHCQMMEETAINEIAEKAAEKAIEKLTAHVYQEIGRGIVSKFIWLAGAITVGLSLWLNSKGLLK